MLADLPFINPPAFDDEFIENKIHHMIEGKGIKIVKNAELLQILEDEENNLEFVLFKLLDIPDEVEEDDEPEGIDEKSEHESRLDGMNGDGDLGDGDIERSQ